MANATIQHFYEVSKLIGALYEKEKRRIDCLDVGNAGSKKEISRYTVSLIR